MITQEALDKLTTACNEVAEKMRQSMAVYIAAFGKSMEESGIAEYYRHLDKQTKRVRITRKRG